MYEKQYKFKLLTEEQIKEFSRTFHDSEEISELEVMKSLAIEKEGDIDIEKDKIKTLIIKPQKHPIVQEIENSLQSLQNIVEGNIETIDMKDAIVVINAEGKLKGLEGNRKYGNDILVGNMIIVGMGANDDFISLTADQINKYSTMFYESENIMQEEIQTRFMCY